MGDTLMLFFCGNGTAVGASQPIKGKLHWTYTEHRKDGKVFGKRAVLEQLDSAFAHLPELAKDLIRATPEDDLRTRLAYDLPFSWKWGEGDVTLIGDAASSGKIHAAFGIPLAITDVENLVRQIDNLGLNRNALRWYELWRVPQAAFLKLAYDSIFSVLYPPQG